VPGTEIRIVAEDGSDVAPGEVGELWAKGPTIMQGYWRQPELTAARIVDGWLRTGDLARIDDTFMYIEGRVDDVINRGGEKILPAHVEGLIAQAPGVALSTVFGVPDSILQFRVFAAVEERADGSFDEASTLASLRHVLPDYAVPERIFIQTPLPRTASGKVDRRATAAVFASANTRDAGAK
jgi:long-chain acyl-CoA synthetase